MTLSNINANAEPQSTGAEPGQAQAETAPDAVPQKRKRKKGTCDAGTEPMDLQPDAKAAPTTLSKSEIVLKKLRSAKGATINQLVEATGWQAHSVRGFLSGTIKKKLGLSLSSEVGKDGLRRYRVAEQAK